MKSFHLHLVSDATGETVHSVARACLVQFEGIQPMEHHWPLVRTKGQINKIISSIKSNLGVVLYTIVKDELREALEVGCDRLHIPCISVLEPVIHAFGTYLGLESIGKSGKQHTLDAEYFKRIDAMTYALNHDDGQLIHDIVAADVVLVGVSRTSKTPTCIYLANKGLKAANVPIVQGINLSSYFELLDGKRDPLIVGLTTDPKRLIEIRRNRLRSLGYSPASNYIDPEAVYLEVTNARRLFTEKNWPVIDVTRRSIEETVATILQYLGRERNLYV